MSQRNLTLQKVSSVLWLPIGKSFQLYCCCFSSHDTKIAVMPVL